MAATPCLVTLRKWWGWEALAIASIAPFVPPSVPFLKPTGMLRPEASSRCTWLSEVRAPIAPHDTKSARNWGLIGSRNSVPAGSPSAATSARKRRARRRPSLIAKLPSSLGSLMSPFQPTVVRGFSK